MEAPAISEGAGSGKPFPRCLAIVPAFQERDAIAQVIADIRAQAPVEIVVIDDGSGDGTAAAAVHAGARVITLPFNLGIGSAVQTGYMAAQAGDFDVAIQVDGWRIGLGICKDTGVDQHIAGTAALNIDVYLAGLVHLPEELDVQEERGIRIARICGAYVAFASFAGPTGGGYERTAGVSSIWAPDGTPLARAGSEPGGVARATLT